MNMMLGGYTKRAIAKIVHCGRNTVTKYLNGDYGSLCRKEFCSGMNNYYDFIINELSAGTSRKDVYRKLKEKGYHGGQLAAYDYMIKSLTDSIFRLRYIKVLQQKQYKRRKGCKNMSTYQEAAYFVSYG